MKNISRHYGLLEIIERLPSSINGNPRYLAKAGGFTFRTPVDSMHGYSITNYRNKNVVVTIGQHYGVPTLNSIVEA